MTAPSTLSLDIVLRCVHDDWHTELHRLADGERWLLVSWYVRPDGVEVDKETMVVPRELLAEIGKHPHLFTG